MWEGPNSIESLLRFPSLLITDVNKQTVENYRGKRACLQGVTCRGKEKERVPRAHWLTPSGRSRLEIYPASSPRSGPTQDQHLPPLHPRVPAGLVPVCPPQRRTFSKQDPESPPGLGWNILTYLGFSFLRSSLFHLSSPHSSAFLGNFLKVITTDLTFYTKSSPRAVAQPVSPSVTL